MKDYILIGIVIIILLIILILGKNKKEHMTTSEYDDIDYEALQNITSMYSDGVLTATSLNVTGDINATGDISSDGQLRAVKGGVVSRYFGVPYDTSKAITDDDSIWNDYAAYFYFQDDGYKTGHATIGSARNIRSHSRELNTSCTLCPKTN